MDSSRFRNNLFIGYIGKKRKNKRKKYFKEKFINWKKRKKKKKKKKFILNDVYYIFQGVNKNIMSVSRLFYNTKVQNRLS